MYVCILNPTEVEQRCENELLNHVTLCVKRCSSLISTKQPVIFYLYNLEGVFFCHKWMRNNNVCGYDLGTTTTKHKPIQNFNVGWLCCHKSSRLCLIMCQILGSHALSLFKALTRLSFESSQWEAWETEDKKKNKKNRNACMSCLSMPFSIFCPVSKHSCNPVLVLATQMSNKAVNPKNYQ